jgi:D-amino-acid dehydrogenase
VTVADVAIVGGGIVGTSAAAFLAEAGAKVVLYERTTLAAGASGRNSGVIQRPFEPTMARLYEQSVDLYRILEATHSGPFRLPARPAGMLLVALDPANAEAAFRTAVAAAPDLAIELLAPGEAARVEPALAPDVSACRLPIGYPVPPALATLAYGELARRHRVDIRQDAYATLVIERGRAAGVRVGRRVERAAAVLVTAGPWSPRVVDPTGGWRPIRPLWGVVVEVALADPPRHVLEEAEVEGVTAAGTEVAGDPVAFSLVTAAGMSSLGSTFLDVVAEPDPGRYAGAIHGRGARFVPAVAGAPTERVRMCARPLSFDGRPLVGEVPGVEGLWIAAGHGPWGISTGPATARLVADRLLGRRAPIPVELDPARFAAPRVA